MKLIGIEHGLPAGNYQDPFDSSEYAAPETVLDGQMGPKADVWSLGVTVSRIARHAFVLGLQGITVNILSVVIRNAVPWAPFHLL